MKYLYAPDWSSYLNNVAASSRPNALALSRLGSELRWLYRDLINLPLSERLGALVRELSEQEPEQ